LQNQQNQQMGPNEPLDAAAELLEQGVRPPTDKEQADLARHRETAAVPDGFEGKKDRAGNPFSPLIHELDKEGKPALNKDGTLRKKRGDQYRTGLALWKKERAHVAPAADDPAPPAPGPLAGGDGGGAGDDRPGPVAGHPDFSPPLPVRAVPVGEPGPAGSDMGPDREGLAREAFLVVLTAIVSLLMIFFGKRWDTTTDEEEAFAKTGGQVFAKRGVHSVPPEAGLASTSAGYFTRRVPEEKMARFRKWVGGMFVKRRPAPPAPDGELADG
jgi:hypothetical protein